jgi:hypothetical protein
VTANAGDVLAGRSQSSLADRISQIGLGQGFALQVISYYRQNPGMAGDGRTPEGSLIARRRDHNHAVPGSLIQSLF